MTYETVIGLEVHAQLATQSKIFCSCSAAFGAEPNSHTCSGCQGLPGTLPHLNDEVVNSALRLGLAVKGHINKISTFERKHYFYPDLPGGYQITQNTQPIIVGGQVEITTENGPKTIRLHHIHLEEDAGKLVHDADSHESLVDLNRAGCALLEIVSEPDLRSSEEVIAYLKAVRELLIYLNISDGNMEEGSLRCDVNVSLRPRGSTPLGVRAELKNINSFRNIARAISYEVRRQEAALNNGEPLKRQTRLFNESDGSTKAMREKEESQDYRYFNDPNLPPVLVSEERLAQAQARMPELGATKRIRYAGVFKLPEQDLESLCQNPELAAYFEETLALFSLAQGPKEAKTVANWILTEFLRELSQANISPAKSLVKPANMAELLTLTAENQLSGRLAKEIFPKMCLTGRSAKEIMAEENIEVVADHSSLAPLVEEVLSKNPDQVAQFLAGKEKVMGFLVGQVMKISGGQAEPKIAGELIRQKIKEQAAKI